jgi:hypothetical protein
MDGLRPVIIYSDKKHSTEYWEQQGKYVGIWLSGRHGGMGISHADTRNAQSS